MRVKVAVTAALAILLGTACSRPVVPPPPNSRVAVLMYHHLAPPTERPEEPGVITPERFESHLQMLRAEGYRLISASQFADYMERRLSLPGRSVLLTFDDGYESNYTLGYPLLRKYSAPALIFPVMKFFDADGKGAWSPHLAPAEAREMLASGLVSFGGHSYDGHSTVATGPDGKQTEPWLIGRAWLKEQGRAETSAEYRQRIHGDLSRAASLLRSIGVTDEALHFSLPNGASTPEEMAELKSLGFRFIYSIDSSRLNDPAVMTIHRIDAGGPHASADWLKDRLDKLY